MNSSSYKVAVLIVSYNSATDIQRCLCGLEESTHVAFDVRICENGGAEAFNYLSSSLPSQLAGGQAVLTFQAPSNLGYAGGINFLLDKITGSTTFWVLNPDAVPYSDTLQLLLERLDVGDCSAVGHDIYWLSGELASRGGKWRSLMAQGESIGMGSSMNTVAIKKEVEAEMNYIVGASMLISTDFLNRVGRMRSDYFLYCEEVEWCLRALRMGERLGYAPGAKIVHSHGTSTGGGGDIKDRSRTAVYLTERGRILVTRDMYPRALLISACVALVSMTLRYGRRSAWRQLAYGVQGWAAGLRNERGPPKWLPATLPIPA